MIPEWLAYVFLAGIIFFIGIIFPAFIMPKFFEGKKEPGEKDKE